MGFFKSLFNSNPLTLRELIDLNAEEGLYKGEIFNELKKVVFFIALPEPIDAPINFSDHTQQYIILHAPDNRGFFLPAFIDQASLKQRNDKLVPHMIDIKTTAKILENPYFYGLLFCCGQHEIMFTRNDLLRLMPSAKT